MTDKQNSQAVEAAKLADPENRRAGDYEWRQLSMWDFAAPNQIELYAPMGSHVFHYVLLRITKVNGNRWTTEPVTSINGVPSSVLTWREGTLFHRASLASQQEVAAPVGEADMLQVIDERDSYHEVADDLAAQIAAITGQEIGEHSSANDPWRNAMLAADEFIAQQLRDMVVAASRVPVSAGGSVGAVPEGYALVPVWLTQEMDDVIANEGWQWEDLLAAAGAITLEQYDEVAATPATEQAAPAASVPAGGGEAERAQAECDAITELNHAQWLALENVRTLASRHRKEEWAQHMLRFCDAAGNAAQTFRAAPLQPQDANDARLLDAAFDDGWRLCTKWALRDDLLADTGSKPYREARAVCIAAILATKGTP